jgi:hypothetical protein
VQQEFDDDPEMMPGDRELVIQVLADGRVIAGADFSISD